MIDVVVMDLGGVLVRWDPPAFVRETIGEGPRALAAATHIFGSGAWRPLDRGDASEAEVVAALVSERPDLEPEIRALFAGLKDCVTPLPASVAALERLKAEGVPVYLLSNIFAGMYDHLRAKYDFFDHFDGMGLSYRHHVVKPERRIYELLCERYALDPARSLFVDDNAGNTAAAAELGFSTVTFGPGMDLYSEIARFLR